MNGYLLMLWNAAVCGRAVVDLSLPDWMGEMRGVCGVRGLVFNCLEDVFDVDVEIGGSK